MSLDFIYTGPSSYRTYLAGLYQRDKIDIAIAKPVRAAVGSAAEIYGGARPALREAVRDLRYGGADEAREILSLNLTHACAALDPVAADVVGGFHALFDEAAASPRAEDGEAERLLARLAALTARQEIAEALRLVSLVLAQCPALCAEDSRFEWVRARLLAGIAGQPKSIAVLDLPAAERSFLAIAARAAADRPGEAAAALIAAGKCAYAEGRFRQARAHCLAALARDPAAAEAYYQLARLRRHAGDLRGSGECLTLAFAAGYGYALRAASDPLFRTDTRLLCACVRAATGRAAAATRDALVESLARLRFLARHADQDFPVASLARFAPTRDAIVTLVSEPAAPTLRKAQRQSKTAGATHPSVTRLAQDYCALLRGSEETIVRRGAERPAGRDPGRIARWMTRAAEASVVGVLIAVVADTFDFAAAAPFPEWRATASASSLGLALAVLHLWLMMHTSFLRRPMRHGFERAVAALQARSRARFERGLPKRVARNRRRLHERISRIEREFGIEASYVG